MKILASLTLIAALFFTGCTTQIQPGVISPALVQLGVSTGVSYALIKNPSAKPYLQVAAPIICSAASGTNLAPAQVIAALNAIPDGPLKTPEAILIANAALSLYIGVWSSYGEGAVSNSPVLKGYLQATCDGINSGLGIDPRRLSAHRQARDWPVIRFSP